MGAFTFSVTQQDQPDLSKTVKLPDADIERVVAAYQPAADAVFGAATREQVFDFMLSRLVQSTMANVMEIEKEKAIAQLPASKPLDIS